MSRTILFALTLLISSFAGSLPAAPELADNPRTLTEYDADGRVTRTTDAYGNLIGFAKYNETTGALEVQDLTDPAFSYASLTSEYLFTGEQWDADLGMYFLRARYLNTATGRFHNMDSYEGRNGEPLTLHKYLYVHANPVMGIDPTGQSINLRSLGQTVGSLISLSNTTFRTAGLFGSRLLFSTNMIKALVLGRNITYAMILRGPSVLNAIERGAAVLTLAAGGTSLTLTALAEVLDEMAVRSATNRTQIPHYPIQDRGAAGENAAGANLGGNVSRIDSLEVRQQQKVGVQIVTTSAETEEGILRAVKSKVRNLRGAEQTRIYGTTTAGQRINLPPNTFNPGGIGILVQVRESASGVIASESFLNKLSQIMRQSGRAIRAVPLRRF